MMLLLRHWLDIDRLRGRRISQVTIVAILVGHHMLRGRWSRIHHLSWLLLLLLAII